jgi:uncharacterized coiled-coil DUF342 family protein
MASSKTGDLLGLLAFGSLIGNFVQGPQKSRLADEKTWWASQAESLKQAYDGLITQYRNLVQRYEQVKRLNEQLFGEVTCLREQCDGLARERSALLRERDDLRSKLDASRRKTEERPQA